MRFNTHWLPLALLSSLLLSCASPQPSLPLKQQPIIAANTTDSDAIGWRSVSFHLQWQRDSEPDWTIGTLIAGEIIAPILSELRPQITAWRFHRRAADDATGHTFNFIVYSSAHTAEKIYARVTDNSNTMELKQSGQITAIVFDPLDRNLKPKREDTSDTTWPPAIKKTWPVFIMGASQMWLDLIMQLKSELPNDNNLFNTYQTIQQQITALWKQHGQHAWLHHLNAVYGYSPIDMRF
ncbi:MAG: hypothetical protein QX197_03980 [Methylococcaceae bacterium]